MRLAGAEEQAAEKKRLRAAALEKRDSLTAQQRRRNSDSIIKKLTGLPCYRDADAVLTYISFRSEVDTMPLTEQAFADGKAVFAPKVTGKEMEFYRIFSLDDLSAGYRGIMEPAGGLSFGEWMNDQIGQCFGSQQESLAEAKEAGKRMRKEKPDAEGTGDSTTAFTHILICMPGAAFDKERHRIGYGGGFYDRYVSRLLQKSEHMDAAGHSQVKVTTAALAYDCQIFEEIPWEAHDIRPARIITETDMI